MAVAVGLAAAGFAAAGGGVTASSNDTTNATTSAPTTTTTPRTHRHRRAQQIVPQATAKEFPRWAIGGFALAGVLIITGLAGFVFTRTRP